MANGVRAQEEVVMAAKTNPIPSVWARQQAEPDQPALSRAAIVREAIVMLDAEGVEALSMRKLGTRLNTAATSLYRHVATKDELMELAMDEIFGEVVVPDASGTGWRVAASEASRSFRATALRHPWLASVAGQAGLAYLGPNLMSFTERVAALFTAAGFPEPSRAIDTLLSYVLGMSTTEAAWLTTVARSGQTETEFVARLMPAAQPGAPADLDPAEIRQDKFEYGLEVVLDGLEARIPR
jgi:AcrR family transcriptional regulator